jgi:pSer/pThr/pTyr-binding forkhead associated (FHA) protein
MVRSLTGGHLTLPSAAPNLISFVIMIHRLTIVVVSFLTVCSVGARDQTEAGQSWGYLYSVRTLRLYELGADDNAIGRRADSAVVLTSPRVSRQHAEIRRTETSVELVDVGSSNGSKLNGKTLCPRVSVTLEPGDRILLADELLLYDTSLASLWLTEIRSRILTRIVRLMLDLPQDEMRKSLGRERIVPAVTEAKLSAETGIDEVEHSVELDPERGFPRTSSAFVGNVEIKDQTLELSLWMVERGESMTGRRASLSNLKHTTLRISPAEGSEREMTRGPWFSSEYLGAILGIFPEQSDLTLRFSNSLASQERPVALRDAAIVLFHLHGLEPEEWKLLILATRSTGLWVEGEVLAKRNRLSPIERTRLLQSLADAAVWLADARELGAGDTEAEEAAEILTRAYARLEAL